MITLADLKIKADASEVVDAKEKITDLGREIPGVGGAVDLLGDAFDQLKNPIAAAIGLVTAAAAGLIALGVQAIESADKLGKISEATGQASADLQLMSEIAGRADASLEQVDMQLTKLSARMADAAAGGAKEFTAALEYFGVELKNAEGQIKSQIQITQELAEAYVNTTAGADRDAAAAAALGNGYRTLFDYAREAADQEAILAEMYEKGAIASTELQEAVGEYNGELDSVGITMQGVGNQIAGMLIPMLQGLVTWFNNSYESGGLVRIAFEAITLAVGGVVVAFRAVGVALSVVDYAARQTTATIYLLGDLLEALADWDASKASAAWTRYTDRVKNNTMELAKEVTAQFKTIEASADQHAVEMEKKQAASSRVTRGAFVGSTASTKSSSKTGNDELDLYRIQSDLMKDVNRELDEINRKREVEARIAEKNRERVQALAESYINLGDPMLKYIRQLEEVNELERQGLLTAEQAYLAREKLYEQSDKLGEKNKEVADESDQQFKELKDAVEGYTQRMADAFVDFAITGKNSFGDMARSILLELARMLANQAFKQLGEVLGGSGKDGGWGGLIQKGISWAASLFSSANGNVFAGGSLQQFANGDVMSKPTYFPLAGGVGLGGEAGEEAIMPLRRLASGRLGVESVGRQSAASMSSTSVVIENINVTADSTTDGNKIGRQVGEQIKAIVLQTLHNEKRTGNSLNPVTLTGSFN